MTATVSHDFSDRPEPSVEEDVIYLDRVGGEWLGDYRRESGARLEELADELRTVAGVDPRTRVATGDPAQAALQLAQETGAELLAVGSHGHGFFTRMLLGSTSTRLLRGASCAVLVAPPRAASPELEHVEERRAALAGTRAEPVHPTLAG